MWQAKIPIWGVYFLLCQVRHFDPLLSTVLLRSDVPRGLRAVAAGAQRLWLAAHSMRRLVEVSIQRLHQESLARAEWHLCDSPPPLCIGARVCGKRESMCFMACFANVRIKGFPGVNGGTSAESPEWQGSAQACAGGTAFLGSDDS